MTTAQIALISYKLQDQSVRSVTIFPTVVSSVKQITIISLSVQMPCKWYQRE